MKIIEPINTINYIKSNYTSFILLCSEENLNLAFDKGLLAPYQKNNLLLNYLNLFVVFVKLHKDGLFHGISLPSKQDLINLKIINKIFP